MQPILGITIGDPAGIGPEIVVKALWHPELFDNATLVVIGDYWVISDALRITRLPLRINRITSTSQASRQRGTVNLIDLNILQPGCWEYKRVSALCGKAAFSYAETAAFLAMDRQLDAVVTAPLSKRALKASGYPYAGYTDIFVDLTHTQEYAMMLSNDRLRVIHVTNHVSLKQVSASLTTEKVLSAIHFAQLAVRQMGIETPRIIVSGLNPHASTGNLFGMEEEEIIAPAVRRANMQGLRVEGPGAPDKVFLDALAGQYDIVVSMYHDQGHIPFMLSCMALDPNVPEGYRLIGGTNSTIGLPFIRTSVDHTEMFPIAGDGVADESNLLHAIQLAVTMAQNVSGMALQQNRRPAPMA